MDGAEIQRIINGLDAHAVQPAAVQPGLRAGDRLIQDGEACFHVPDVCRVLRGYGDRNNAAVEGQINGGVVVVRGAGNQSTDKYDN